MALTTRCPQCGTSFKVVPDQLRVRNGLVRCGACATVFDGRACLLPETGAGMPAAAIPASNTPIAAPAPAASQAIAAPVLVTPPAPPVADGAPPPVRRPSVEPREVAPWDDLPDEPASPGIHPGASGASPAAAPSVAPTDEPAPGLSRPPCRPPCCAAATTSAAASNPTPRWRKRATMTKTKMKTWIATTTNRA
ncbi:zinc-ribbon domain-containing protein [Achromobacter xylosoxidans]